MALEALDPFNVRRQLARLGSLPGVKSAATDVSFLVNAREALLPLPLVDRLAGGAEAIEQAALAPYRPLVTINELYPERPDRD